MDDRRRVYPHDGLLESRLKVSPLQIHSSIIVKDEDGVETDAVGDFEDLQEPILDQRNVRHSSYLLGQIRQRSKTKPLLPSFLSYDLGSSVPSLLDHV